MKSSVLQLAAKRAQLQTQAEREAPHARQTPPLLVAQVAARERWTLALRFTVVRFFFVLFFPFFCAAKLQGTYLRKNNSVADLVVVVWQQSAKSV